MHSGYHLQCIYCTPRIVLNTSQEVFKFIISKPYEYHPHFHMKKLKTQGSFETCPRSQGGCTRGCSGKESTCDAGDTRDGIWSLGREMLWTDPAGLQSMGSRRVRQEWVTEHPRTHQVLVAVFRMKSNEPGTESQQTHIVCPHTHHTALLSNLCCC